MDTIIGLDIGGTKISIVLAEAEAGQIRFLDNRVFPTGVEQGLAQALDNLLGHLDSLISKHQLDPALICFGIACGGPLDSRQGVILSPPNLIGWDHVEIVRLLEQRYKARAFLQNDANACALAEWLWGAGQDVSDLAFLTFGTGLGAGLILGGRLYEGGNGMAGEVGHIRLEPFGPSGYGKAGSFEGFCSGGGISQLARILLLEKLQQGVKPAFCPEAGMLADLTAKDVFDAAHAGDPAALDIVRVCGSYLGKGLSVLIDILNPQMIILGTIFVHNHDLLVPAMQQAIDQEALGRSARICRIVPAALNRRIGDYASVAAAIYGKGNE